MKWKRFDSLYPLPSFAKGTYTRRRAAAARSEGELRAGIECIGVHALRDGHAACHFAVIVIEHHHQLVTAAGEQAVAPQINRQCGRAGGRMRGLSGAKRGFSGLKRAFRGKKGLSSVPESFDSGMEENSSGARRGASGPASNGSGTAKLAARFRQ